MIISPQRQLDALLRNDLVAFTQRVFAELNPGRRFELNWHHEAIAYLLDVTAVTQELDRLVVNLPPRSLKSIMVTVALPAYPLGRDPTRKIITVCYNQDLANEFSRKTRQVMRSDWYRRLFPSTQIVGQGAETAFYTTAGGFRMATSVEGTLTGRGGDLIILDDPQKAADATSETRRESLYQWITQTLFTRLDDKRTGGIILVQQRLHEDDLSGRLLRTGEWNPLIIPSIALKDEVICLGRYPAPRFHQRAKSDLLDPAREPRTILDGLAREMGSAAFVAQYQQDPLPPDGDIIKVGWFKRYKDLPQDGQVVFSIDTASKAGVRNDWSVISVWRLAQGRFYLEYVWRRRVEYPELRAQVIELAQHLAPDTILIEDKGTGTGLIQELRAHENGYPVKAFDPGSMDKESRMKVQSAKIEGGLVLLPPSAPWLDDFLDEVRRFPNGAHDDQIDAMSQLLDFGSKRTAGKLIILR
jgi:predicted phage terminase large subunit-like protein